MPEQMSHTIACSMWYLSITAFAYHSAEISYLAVLFSSPLSVPVTCQTYKPVEIPCCPPTSPASQHVAAPPLPDSRPQVSRRRPQPARLGREVHPHLAWREPEGQCRAHAPAPNGWVGGVWETLRMRAVQKGCRPRAFYRFPSGRLWRMCPGRAVAGAARAHAVRRGGAWGAWRNRVAAAGGEPRFRRGAASRQRLGISPWLTG